MDTTVRLGPLKFSLQATIDHHGLSIDSGGWLISTDSIDLVDSILRVELPQGCNDLGRKNVYTYQVITSILH